MTNSLKVMLAV